MTRILIIEDDAYTQQIIEASICGPDQRIVAVSDGDEAMRLLSQEHFDFVLTDLFHPGLFGLEIVSQIRSDHSLRNIRIGVISGHAHGEMVTEAQRRGADFVLAKPFDPKSLRDMFERINCRGFKKIDIEKPCPCIGIVPKYRFLHETIIGDLSGEIIIVILWRCNACGMFRCERRIVQQGQIPLRLEPPED
jgi:two-component system chemotaxis response regulator CheY